MHSDYFSNHSHKLRFPWRLYHGPTVEACARAILQSPGPDVLNVGSGPFFELRELPREARRFTICDIDPRAIEVARESHGNALQSADVIEPSAPLPYATGRFDLVISMDVIEHVPDPRSWVAELLRVLKPAGKLFVTTPNYASRSLRWIENTALELVARAHGFSRRHIHPTKMTPRRLEETLGSAGARDVELELVAFGWVIAAQARKG